MVNKMITYMDGQNPHVLHRLDMDTSGLLLFAKNSAIVPGIHRQFRWELSTFIRHAL
jgi:23S rRNA-/tRNA-specific pseudouridylate synthase